MKLITRVDGRALRHHFSYHWWVYALIVALSFVVWNLIYAQTAYRAPGDKRIDLYVQTQMMENDQSLARLRALGAQAAPEIEEVNLISLLPPSAQDMYANVQLVTFMSAREGDIFVLAAEDFKRFAAQGAFLPLEDALLTGKIGLALDEGLKPGYITVLEPQEEGGEKPAPRSRLYGLPLRGFPKAMELLGLIQQDMFLAVPYYTENPESTLAFISLLLKQ